MHDTAGIKTAGFSPCNVRGKIAGKPVEMVVDSGCTRTLVHKKYIDNNSLTSDKITVLLLRENDSQFL